MGLRSIIQIDEELCDGCGECVPSCAEGALQIIDGKARLVSDVLCDGLGACLGECPTGALQVIQRDAPEFDEAVVAQHLGGPVAHRKPSVPGFVERMAASVGGGCPGSRVQTFDEPGGGPANRPASASTPIIKMIPLQDRSTPAAPGAQGPSASGSKLRQWPVQLHLVPPTAPFFQGKDVLLAADCVPVAVGDFHTSFLDGRGLAIACPKLDQHLEVYVEKLAAMIDQSGIRSLTVAIMEVPCCSGLVRLAAQAQAAASRKIPLRLVKVGIRGDILEDHEV
ncbi:MAG: 4Fe-4S binding protein [Acidobacteria bacterium]|nr:4Fe-4S binding protein [Acidobacteriota bacterium]